MVKNLPCNAGTAFLQESDSWTCNTPHATGQLSLSSTAAEASVPRAHALQEEKTLRWETWAPQLESSTHLPQIEKSAKSQHSQEIIVKNK